MVHQDPKLTTIILASQAQKSHLKERVFSGMNKYQTLQTTISNKLIITYAAIKCVQE